MPDRPFMPVQYLKGVGPRRAELLSKLGIETVYDLLLHCPSGYYDRRTMTPLGRIRAGEKITVRGIITGVRSYRSRRKRLPILEVSIEDEGDHAVLVWFGQSYREREFRAGESVVAAGKAEVGEARLHVEEYEILGEGRESFHATGLVPSYPATEGLSKRLIRTLVRTALEEVGPELEEVLPAEVRSRRRLPPVQEALRRVHFPATPEEAEAGRRRLAYEELFTLQAGMALRRRATRRERAGTRLAVSDALDFRIRARFPFELTGAQERAVRQIRRDLGAERPMNRLLQGDVGSGKTVVAAYALLAAVGRKSQAALMAPTEILAEQHAGTFGRLLERSRVRMAYLGAGVKGAKRKAVLEGLKEGTIDLVIGTHALVEKGVAFRNLGLVVIDEQQKFGVLQRAALGGKGARPHVLVMTATPIPRTLVLSVYGDLDLTVLDEMPPGRREVRTMFVTPAGRRDKYAFIRSKLREGRQAFFIYPLVDDSDKAELRSAIKMAESLRGEFEGFRVGLVHGRMKPEEKDAVMEAFRAGKIHLLVSTIVVEVGIDVPNASIMVIDHCERYGLAQLHQLRGRIGRGSYESHCLLFGRKNERIDAFTATNDGFKIAEADLRIRGPGDVAGTRQSGLLGFRAADLLRDAALLEQSREDAFAFVEHDPKLASAPGLRRALGRFPSLLHVG